MIEVGRLCVKTAGRDAMQYCVVVDNESDKFVVVDGNTRRKRVNISHIEPLGKKLDIKKGADTKTVLDAFEKEGIEVKKSSEKKEEKSTESTSSSSKSSSQKKSSSSKSSSSKSQSKSTKKESSQN